MNLALLALVGLVATESPARLPPSGKSDVPLPSMIGGATYRVLVNLQGSIARRDRVRVEVRWPGGVASKTIHAGDPDYFLPIRPSGDGRGTLELESDPGTGQVEVRHEWGRLDLRAGDDLAIEAEPNDSWRLANPLEIGRAVYGSSDDVDYLDNLEEGKAGLDWFRFEVRDEQASLYAFQLELLDRDVSSNLRVYRLDPASGEIRLEESGKDPMEIVHDRERERYSTRISRTLAKGTYFVEVNANHPDYILRTSREDLPPYQDPSKAVEVGLSYLLEAGDGWFSQVPREGNIFVRSNNLHDTATRCTACHASSFPTEAALVGLSNGYPIVAKSSMLSLMERLVNSPTPLYGGDGLSWQRFIAIPLQAQGKQGGIVFDFEEQVLGREQSASSRFGPFLRAAWRGRRSLPADEVNGVVPLDSKFGLAWRDWRVLTRLATRTGRIAYAQGADAIADILDDPATDEQVETRQDRIHRLYAWWLVDKDHFAGRIQAEADALLALQNPDGGWHEVDRKPGPSADYTTGQLTWTLLKIGFRREDPRITRALGYLLARQQPFGGWFQPTTHENFRTPMRETRYAVEALAEAYPRPGTSRKGWGNRDGQGPRLPRDGPIVRLLDDLENLWDVPDALRPEFTAALVPFLSHAEPLVRARAAACLGRVGDASSVEGLAGRLGDPSKAVWRSAAWALRRLGNRGIGLEAIRAALQDPNPSIRRGALRIFAYQFWGMDERVELADLVIARVGDADLWTRLQALRSLRQWFYRTNDPSLRRRIVDVYLARMAEPDEPVVRKALVEGMYILLDENLGGGVSLQKNLASLPEKFRGNAIEGRKAVERDILLGPILEALATGNPRQREAIVRSFDGSFFRGRTYARQPSGMLDVGNDREFGFLVEPPLDRLETAFSALWASELEPVVRRRSIQLAAFFQLPGRSANGVLQSSLLRGLEDPDPGVREASRDVVGRDLDLRGAEDDPLRVVSIKKALRGDDAGRRAVVRAIARNPALMAKGEIRLDLRAILKGPDPRALFPVLGHPSFEDAEVLAIASRAWPTTDDPPDRLALLGAIESRSGVVDSTDPPAPAVEVLRLAVVDRSSQVREKAVEVLGRMGRLRAGKSADRLLLAVLADDSPRLRSRGLAMASTLEGFWERADAIERLLALLVDPDVRVRGQALEVVELRGLARSRPAIARRVQSLASDPSLGKRAVDCLERQGFEPGSIEADVRPGRVRVPGFANFRTRVNPYFTRAGEDGHSCSRCHATHGVLRIAEGLDLDSVLVNYNSALKVINLGDPQSSLLLRKPLSPSGQGAPDEVSPTGLSHVGGPRWDGTDHPAYRAILGWIREAPQVDDSPAPIASADHHAPGSEAALAVDGDPSTSWQTESVGANPGYPHELVLDLGSSRPIEGLRYTPRQDSSKGRVKEFEVGLSDDGKTWSTPAARGIWPDEPGLRYVGLDRRHARFVKLRGLSEVNGLPGMSVGELVVEAPARPGVEGKP